MVGKREKERIGSENPCQFIDKYNEGHHKCIRSSIILVIG